MENLKKMIPDPVRVDVGGERLEITPIKVRELPALVRSLGPLAPIISKLGKCLDDVGDKKNQAEEVIARADQEVASLLGDMGGKKSQAEAVIADILSSHADKAGNLLDAVAVCLRKDRSWVDDLDLDELVMLVGKVLEVNADFFARRLLPAFTRVIDMVTEAIGEPQSMGLSGPDIDSEMSLA